MPSVIEIAQSFRARLLRREATALRAVVGAYMEAATAIKKRIDEMLAGGELSENQVRVLARLQSLERQIQVEITAFADLAASAVIAAQADAVGLAIGQAAEILSAFDRLPVRQIEAITSAFERQALVGLFEDIGIGLSREARRIFTSGIAQGASASTVAKELRDSLGIGMNRAMTISRTQIMTAYREANIESYKAAGVTRYMWLASLSSRTCATCLALNGKTFDTDEPFATHPRCRCTLIPVTDSIPRLQSGSAWLAGQDVATQMDILGKSGYAAIQSGAVNLSDFVGEGRSAKFGPYRYQKSLKEILGRDEAKRFYKRAV